MRIERRAVARYRTKLFVQIEIDDYKFDATTTEISLQGLRVLCKGSIANSAFNQYIRVTPGENVVANILIKAPQKSGLAISLKCHAKVITINRLSQDCYVVGFSVIDFLGNGQDHWHELIAKKH